MNPPSNFSNNSLFIGDLSKFCSESNLESLFAPFGQIVDVKIKRNNTTGKTLSYGFVSFANDECAATAMDQLNGYSFYGRNLRYLLNTPHVVIIALGIFQQLPFLFTCL